MRDTMQNELGFSLVELAIVLTVIGLMLLVGIPAYRSMSQDQQLHGAAIAIGGQVQAARLTAMTTGRTQTLNFDTSTNPPSVYTVDLANSRVWTLPHGIRFVAGPSFTMGTDGRASASQYIVLQNERGFRDTVSVETSGLVIAR